MPIVATQAVSKEIKSLLFANDGSLNVVLTRFDDDVAVGEEAYRINAEQASELLDVETVPGLTIRQQIVASVYQFLIVSGTVKGVIKN